MSTIYVEDSYTLAAGTELDVVSETAFDLDGPGSPILTIAGTLNVSTSADNNLFALTTHASGGASIVIAEGGSYHLTQSGTSWNATMGGLFDVETHFENHGLFDVEASNSGTGLKFVVGGSVDNTGEISVTSAANGAWCVVGTDVVVDNSGTMELFANYGFVTQGAVDNSGLIYASADDTTLGVDATGDFHNTGRIVATTHSGHATGVKIEAFDGVFSNEGRIIATSDGPSDGDAGIGVQLVSGTADQKLTFDNSGLIRADYAFESANFVYGDPQIELDNSGKMFGQVDLGAANDILANSGKIFGDVHLWGGDDVYEAVGKGKVSGVVAGGGGSDLLIGGKGAEVLYGEGDPNGTVGQNTLIGAGGADTLAGGGDVDHFVYDRLTDSTVGKADLITFLQNIDFIDLSKIDADMTHAGNQAFHLVASLDGHVGEIAVNYGKATDTTRVTLDVDGDGKADALIVISGDHHDFTNFVL